MQMVPQALRAYVVGFVHRAGRCKVMTCLPICPRIIDASDPKTCSLPMAAVVVAPVGTVHWLRDRWQQFHHTCP